MPEQQVPRDEAFKRLDDRLDALAASARREPRRFDMEGSGAGYRLIAELIGGVLAGLGLGWLVDRLAGTAPFGLISGVLIGAGTSVFLVARSAGRMSAAAEASAAAKAAAPVEDESDSG
jgi:ATP synthase protein I